MRRILLITNPAAARARPRVADSVVAALEHEGCTVEVAETTGPGDAAEMARQRVERCDAIAVYGGDGTETHEASCHSLALFEVARFSKLDALARGLKMCNY